MFNVERLEEEGGGSKQTQRGVVTTVCRACVFVTNTAEAALKGDIVATKQMSLTLNGIKPRASWLHPAGGYLCTADVDKFCVILKPAACKHKAA